MPLLSGSIALQRFQTLSPTHSLNPDELIESIKKHRIHALDLDDAREEAMGWCHPFSGRPNFERIDNMFVEQSLIFAMRIDTKRIPTTVLRMQTREAVEALLKNAPDPLSGSKKKITKAQKEIIQKNVRDELLKSVLPSIRLVEVVWSLENGELWLGSSSASAKAKFEKLFNETFALPFLPLNPGTLGVDFDKLFSGVNMPFHELENLVPRDLLR